jgi:hypothetical protein
MVDLLFAAFACTLGDMAPMVINIVHTQYLESDERMHKSVKSTFCSGALLLF